MGLGAGDNGRNAEGLATDVERARLTQLGVVLGARPSRPSHRRQHRSTEPVEQLTHTVVHVLNHLHANA